MMAATLARRLGKLEASERGKQGARFASAFRTLVGSLEPRHRHLFSDWFRAHDVSTLNCGGHHHDGRLCMRCIETGDPPSLVHAAFSMLFVHMETGTPVTLPSAVARVYIDHADTVPSLPCSGCGYLLPTIRGQLAFTGTCPGCRLGMAAG